MDVTPILISAIAAIPLLTGQYFVYRQVVKTRSEVIDVKDNAVVAKREATHAHMAAEASQNMLAGNGDGTITAMVEDIKKGQADAMIWVKETQTVQNYKLDSVLAWQGRHEARHEREMNQRNPLQG